MWIQVGENEVVLGVGAAVMESREARPHRRDITLAMALPISFLAQGQLLEGVSDTTAG